MTRLHVELSRLYFPLTAPGPDAQDALIDLADPQGRVRALVLQLARPADWAALSAVWQGVQRDLALPAPAIAISGLEGFQLWFSLAEPVAVPQAQAFLGALRDRYLPDVAPDRLDLLPAADASAPHGIRHARPVPALRETGNWSAFVAPDLAPVFVEAPWLDIEPGDDGQADLLRGLASIAPSDWEAARARLAEGASVPGGMARPVPEDGSGAPTRPRQAGRASPPAREDPESFLRRIMNDDSVALALRIEAAKALLPRTGKRRRRDD